MKVLLIRDITTNYTGGIKKHCEDLANLFHHESDLDVVDMIDLPFHYNAFLRKKIFEYKSLYTYISESSCDVVHIHGFMSIGVIQALIVAKRLKKRVLYSPHFHPFKYIEHPFYGKMFFYTFLRPLLRFVEKIICINNEDSAFFKKFHENVTQIPHWANHVFSGVFSQQTDKRIILFIGRNDSNKGLEHLYNLSNNEYEVHCVTRGELKRTDFIQHQDISDNELNELYSKASVVVVPSRYEAFSLVALEALEHGTPIVISERVRIADYLVGEKGYRIFKYHDFEGFNAAVQSVIGESFDREVLLSPFNSDYVKSQYYKAYMK